MPQSSGDKLKALFADLGRPTLRGIRKCPKCGTVNGTRGNSCKNKSCDVVFRDNGLKRKAFTDACKIVAPDYPYDLTYSVRLRDRGPDYRNFVQIPVSSSTLPVRDNGNGVPEASSQKCYVESCNLRGKEFPCSHIIAAQKCFADCQLLPIKHSVLPGLNIPEEIKEIINICLGDSTDTLVQRVSSTSFVVRCDVSPKHPLGLLHVMFFKPNKFESLDKRYLCACKPQKQIREEALAANNGGFDSTSKYCIHYYACVCAFASCESLSSEFDFILSQVANDLTPALLSQLNLVALPNSNGGHEMDGIDPNHISVEIMRENLSLFESITAGDDAALNNGIEGVLTDPIIVSSVDDNFSLSDATLEELTDSDQQVCQIFSGASNIAMEASFAAAEAERLLSHEGQAAVKRRKDEKSTNCQSEVDLVSSYTNSLPHKAAVVKKGVTIRSDNAKCKQSASQITLLSSIDTYASSQLAEKLAERKQPMIGFEEWLAGVNERINLLMNYGNLETPEPLVFLVYHDFFECLKERIAYGSKKKRLPNQTIVTHRSDACPLKAYTKHIWKITNLLQLLRIFHCSLVPLKPTQYFVKSQGIFIEWTNTAKDIDQGSKNLPIAPILHSTYLKIGKIDASSEVKDSHSFTIEWIPDLLPTSRMGELTLKFEFGHSEPRGNS